jgi:hypothetical protein
VFQFTAVNGKRRVGPSRKFFGHDAGIVSTGPGIYNVQIVSALSRPEKAVVTEWLVDTQQNPQAEACAT